MLRQFRFPFLITIAGVVLAGVLGGPSVAGVVAILAVLEVSLSFDNAVVNATVLQKMDERWQRIFLTVGILIAVFGMRLVFPLLVVTLSSHLSPGRVLDLALNHPSEYGTYLTAAHPAIAAFGGVFLMMIFLDFVFEEREITWLGPIERALARVGKLDQLSVVLTLALLIAAATTFAQAHAEQVLISGIAGLATYLAVSSLSSMFESDEDEDEGPAAAGDDAQDAPQVRLPGGLARAGLFTFIYLEVLDASFSFDGVVGAFAITDRIFVIALGLGIGACYIRSLTVYLVRRGTLGEYVHLEHGAHWAIGALAALLFVTISRNVPELVTGLIGVGFIGAALVSSIVRNRRGDSDAGITGADDVPSARVPGPGGPAAALSDAP